jgi:hypothetical protein
MPNAALAAFERSIACKEDRKTHELAFRPACQSKKAVVARKHYLELPASSRECIAQICIRHGIDPSADPAPNSRR